MHYCILLQLLRFGYTCGSNYFWSVCKAPGHSIFFKRKALRVFIEACTRKVQKWRFLPFLFGIYALVFFGLVEIDHLSWLNSNRNSQVRITSQLLVYASPFSISLHPILELVIILCFERLWKPYPFLMKFRALLTQGAWAKKTSILSPSSFS